MNLLVKNCLLDNVLSDLYIKDGLFSRIAPAGTLEMCQDGLEVLDAEGKTIMPAFANMHTHSAMTLMRGAGEDMSLMTWLDLIWKMEQHLSPEIIYWGTRLACIEMIKTGTVLFNDQYWMIDQASRAVEESGIRANLTYVLLDGFDKEKAARQRDECMKMHELSKSWSEKVSFGISVHGIYTVLEENVRWAAEYSEKHRLPVHIHLSESHDENSGCMERYGKTPTEAFDSMGLLSDRVLAAHVLHMTDSDMATLGKRGVTAVHNINSNLKLASGFRFPFDELKAAGVRVCLGTDGAASSNNLDMLEASKTMALLQKAWRENPAAMPLDEILYTGSASGYEALGLNGGKIAEGKLADFMLVDTDSYAFVPNINFKANLIYSANSSCIDTVVCGGRIVMKTRVVPGETEVYAECSRLWKEMVE